MTVGEIKKKEVIKKAGDIDAACEFLGCLTPEAWLLSAQQNKRILLIDHAHCEKKAASTALNLMFRYVDKPCLLEKMGQLAREELLHFRQVCQLMEKHQVVYEHLTPSRYAKGLRQLIRTEEPNRLIDHLIVGAFIEARSCERFGALSRVVEKDLARYYHFLLKSESRHFEDYLHLAALYSNEPIDARIEQIRQKEAELILSADSEFRLHSGIFQE